MPAFAEILDEEIVPEQPVTTSLLVRLRDNALSFAGAPTATRALWRQTVPPLGWTKLAINDKALRVVSGSITDGGSVPFSTVFGKTTTDGTTLSQAHLPAVSISGSFVGSGSGSATYDRATGNANGALAQIGGTGLTTLASVTNSAIGIGVTVSFVSGSITTNALGSSAPHTHPMDIRTEFIDVVVAERDND